MRHLSSRTFSALVMTGLLAAAVSGCQAEAPTTPFANPGGTGDGGVRMPTVPDASPVDPGMVAPPVLDGIDTTTVYSTVPVHGVASPHSSVLFESDDGTTVTVDVASTGRFCVDAPLVDGEDNRFHVSTIDKWGNQSTKVDFSVTQNGQPQQQQASTESQNAALGGIAKANYLGFTSILDGNHTELDTIDGNLSTSYTGSSSGEIWHIFSSTPDPSIVVKLAAESHINKITAYAPGACKFVKPMELWYTDSGAPSPPNIDPTGWSKAQSKVSTDAMSATATLNATVTHVAVLWPGGEDNLQLGNCGTIQPVYGLAELQAWTVANVAPPAPRAPSCGGNK